MRELPGTWQHRLYALHPDMRARIEYHQSYEPDFVAEPEILYSEAAEDLVRHMRDEAQIYFWTIGDRESRLKIPVRNLLVFSDDELDHVGRLALQFVRNPISVRDVTIYHDD